MTAPRKTAVVTLPEPETEPTTEPVTETPDDGENESGVSGKKRIRWIEFLIRLFRAIKHFFGNLKK